jgi:hypothetical protein
MSSSTRTPAFVSGPWTGYRHLKIGIHAIVTDGAQTTIDADADSIEHRD